MACKNKGQQQKAASSPNDESAQLAFGKHEDKTLIEMNFTYELVNAEHLSEKMTEAIERALSAKSYICQQEFEEAGRCGHEINVLAEADDEAFVANIEIDGNECYVEIDCSKVVFTNDIPEWLS